jgi:hypothetical protein
MAFSFGAPSFASLPGPVKYELLCPGNREELLVYREFRLAGGSVRILDIPYQTQKPHINYCAVAALKMCWDFIRTHLGDRQTPEIGMDDIAAQTRTSAETGVQLSPEFFQNFNKLQSLIKAEWASKVTLARMAEARDAGMPSIVVYYPGVCMTGNLEVAGLAHTAVYLAHSEKEVLIHNPWYGELHRWPMPVFEKSRALLGQQAVLFQRNKQTRLDATKGAGR